LDTAAATTMSGRLAVIRMGTGKSVSTPPSLNSLAF
jgi:hypothetical protein